MTPFRPLIFTSLMIFSGLGQVLAQAVESGIVESGYGVIRGPNYAFSLKAPEGWVIDSKSGVAQGLPAVFYPKGSNWQESPVIAYARSRPRTSKILSVADAVNFAVETLHAGGNPNCSAKYVKTIKTDAGQDAVIYYFSGDQWGHSEATVYFVQEKSIDFMTFNARDENLFKNELPRFEQLAKSYAFLDGRTPSKAGGQNSSPN